MVETWCCPGCSVSTGVSCRGGATGIVKELQVTLTAYQVHHSLVIEHDNITQKGTAKKKSTGRKKEDWHGLSLEEKNEIVSTEIEIYQTAVERVNNFMLSTDARELLYVVLKWCSQSLWNLVGTGSW